jgi:hypothetical protein
LTETLASRFFFLPTSCSLISSATHPWLLFMSTREVEIAQQSQIEVTAAQVKLLGFTMFS